MMSDKEHVSHVLQDIFVHKDHFHWELFNSQRTHVHQDHIVQLVLLLLQLVLPVLTMQNQPENHFLTVFLVTRECIVVALVFHLLQALVLEDIGVNEDHLLQILLLTLVQQDLA